MSFIRKNRQNALFFSIFGGLCKNCCENTIQNPQMSPAGPWAHSVPVLDLQANGTRSVFSAVHQGPSCCRARGRGMRHADGPAQGPAQGPACQTQAADLHSGLLRFRSLFPHCSVHRFGSGAGLSPSRASTPEPWSLQLHTQDASCQPPPPPPPTHTHTVNKGRSSRKSSIVMQGTR